MSRQVWKQILHPGWQEVPGRIVFFDPQGDDLCVWFEHRHVNVPLLVNVYGTGHDIPEGASYLASCQQPPFVWHLYTIDKRFL